MITKTQLWLHCLAHNDYFNPVSLMASVLLFHFFVFAITQPPPKPQQQHYWQKRQPQRQRRCWSSKNTKNEKIAGKYRLTICMRCTGNSICIESVRCKVFVSSCFAIIIISWPIQVFHCANKSREAAQIGFYIILNAPMSLWWWCSLLLRRPLLLWLSPGFAGGTVACYCFVSRPVLQLIFYLNLC